MRGRARRQRDRGIARIVRPHGHEHRLMPAARLARQADQVGPGLEHARIELGPAHGVVDVLHRGRIRHLLAGAEIERDRHDAVRRHGLVAKLLGEPVLRAPAAAVALDQRRKRPLPARLVHARQQRLVAMAEVLHILHVEFLRLGIYHCHGHCRLPFAILRWPIFARPCGNGNRYRDDFGRCRCRKSDPEILSITQAMPGGCEPRDGLVSMRHSRRTGSQLRR